MELRIHRAHANYAGCAESWNGDKQPTHTRYVDLRSALIAFAPFSPGTIMPADQDKSRFVRAELANLTKAYPQCTVCLAFMRRMSQPFPKR